MTAWPFRVARPFHNNAQRTITTLISNVILKTFILCFYLQIFHCKTEFSRELIERHVQICVNDVLVHKGTSMEGIDLWKLLKQYMYFPASLISNTQISVVFLKCKFQYHRFPICKFMVLKYYLTLTITFNTM